MGLLQIILVLFDVNNFAFCALCFSFIIANDNTLRHSA